MGQIKFETLLLACLPSVLKCMWCRVLSLVLLSRGVWAFGLCEFLLILGQTFNNCAIGSSKN